ncbi:hypothetical protein DIE20_11515 [Burkholderia sp. Bp9131]|uniref:hypothetical protein n=1 Tax=Burkholderia sp. Bp9131 TaxID=2184571 RepID=UPI000F565687|nr:hypothetical protein [Burkholderia sp. Bp9131]RQR43487.1 hypothetical protein DIE20_11515 [Burkholderia sp. Bp9131]
MQQSLRVSCIFVMALVTAALSACGGGDSGTGVNSSSGASAASPASSSDTSTSAPAAQVACRPNGKFTYSGSASPVKDNGGKVAVIVVPSLPDDVSKNRNFTATAAPANAQVQQPSGAFTTLATSDDSTDCLGLDHGAVTEIQSVGTDVAIGRWNQAMDTDGNTYSDRQGVHYAVGTPLTLTATSGTLACSLVIADQAAGDIASYGKLTAASATLDLSSRTLNNLSLTIQPTDTGGNPVTTVKAQAPVNGITIGGGMSVQSVVVGHNPQQPLVAIGYKVGTRGGVAVLSCQ